MEQYKQIIIDGVKTSYLVYNDGRVFNQKTNSFLKGSIRGGYKYFQLTTEYWKKNFLAHRLVALMFIEKPDSYDVVHHIDGNKLNNNVENLAWVTYSENAKNVNRTVPRTNSRPKYQYYEGNIAEDEEWRIFRDTHFKISNYGRLWNTKTNRILIAHKDSSGYLYYSPQINGKTVKVLAHRGAYEAFTGYSLSSQEQIDHIDGNRQNNYLSNLRICSSKENTTWRSKRAKEKNNYYIEQLTLNNELVCTYPSIADAAKAIGVVHGSISSCVNGKCPTIKGYKWRKVLK